MILTSGVLSGQILTPKIDTTALIFLKKKYSIFQKENRIPFQDRDKYTVAQANQTTTKSIYDLNESGTLSTALFGGNNQSVSLQSNLNLTLNGKIAKDVFVKAHLSDNNLSQQTTGYSQTLQEFEKLFFEIQYKQHKVRAGDVEYASQPSPFLNAEKQARGFQYQYKNDTTFFQAGVANARGQYTRYNLDVTEGNQGPYLLKGANGEQYIYVLPNSEQVYLNGKKLKAGPDEDYILNYNTGEITFNPRIPISIESRIQIEFEYSQENYTRNIQFADWELKRNNWTFNLGYLSNADNKRAPKDQSLTVDEILLLSESGDQPAFGTSAVEANFDPNRILYAKKDSLGEEIWIYSVDSTSQLYSVKFSFVGEGNGDYILNSNIVAIGNVLEWKKPENGVKQGRYEPVKVLVAPQSLTNTALGIRRDWKNNQYTSLNVALSQEDKNLFSTQDDGDNSAFALRFENSMFLDKNKRLSWVTKDQFVDKKYKSPTPIRNQEYIRQWNLPNTDTLQFNELVIGNTLGYLSKDSLSIKVGLDYLNRQSFFTGVQKMIDVNYKGFNSKNTHLNTSGDYVNSNYLRSFTTYNLNREFLDHTWQLEVENNAIRNSENILDTLSFAFYRLNYGIKTKEFIGGPLMLEGEYRIDDYVNNNAWDRKKQWAFIQAQKLWKFSERTSLDQFLFYKKINSDIDELKDEQLTTRLNFKTAQFKKRWKLHLGYELNQGQDAEQNIQFLQVPVGQGTHIWNDYNSNNVKELNEFEVAIYTYEADYIMLASPGRNYVRTYQNDFTISNRIAVGKFISSKAGIKRMRIRTQHRFGNKVKNSEIQQAISPFGAFSSSDLITQNRSEFYQIYWPYYKRNQVRLIYEDNNEKRLISYGLEDLKLKKNAIVSKVFFNEKHQLITEAERLNKMRFANAFTNRNYDIIEYAFKQSYVLEWEKQKKWTTSLFYANKDNVQGDESLKMIDLNTRLDIKLKSNQFFNLSLSYVNNNFTGNQETSVGYEMLEGLKDGNNLICILGWQKKLNKSMSLVLNYQGRKSQGVQMVHTGQIQIRADL